MLKQNNEVAINEFAIDEVIHMADIHKQHNGVTINPAMENTGSNATVSKQQPKRKLCFITETGKDIQQSPEQKIEGLIEGMLTPGLNLLAAPRKRGKSWLALDMALCVAGKEDFWGRKTGHGKVLFFALEDNRSRIKERINILLDDEDAPEELLVSYSTGYVGSVFYNDLDTFLQEEGDIKLVVIDVLQKIRSGKNSKQSEYEHDYADIGTLKNIADKYGIPILAITHTKKTKDSNDRLNDISGGVGVAGAADTVLMISSGSFQGEDKEAILSITGRDIPDTELSVKFDKSSCKWNYTGTAKELKARREEEMYKSSPLIRAIKMAVEENSGQWEGTCRELMQYASQKLGECIAKSEPSLGRKINKFEELLEKDSIIHIKPNSNGGAAGRKHVFMTKEKAGYMPGTSREADAVIKSEDTMEGIETPSDYE